MSENEHQQADDDNQPDEKNDADGAGQKLEHTALLVMRMKGSFDLAVSLGHIGHAIAFLFRQAAYDFQDVLFRSIGLGLCDQILT